MAEIYDPATGEWSITSPLSGAGFWHRATRLANGQVLLTGGQDVANSVGGAQLYDPESGRWELASKLVGPRALHTSTLLADGVVLIAGGAEGDFDWIVDPLHTAELYGTIKIPKIIGASISGKKLFVTGENFQSGAVIILNGEEQKTRNDDQNPRTQLIGKKIRKTIQPGDRLQVQNPGGPKSDEFTFTGT